MATKVRQNAKQVDNDEGNNNNKNFVAPQTIIAERKEGFKTSLSGVAIVTYRTPLPSNRNTCPPFGERTDPHRLSLSLSDLEETERDFFNETICSQCVESRAKSPGNTRHTRRQELMQHKRSCSTDLRPINLKSDDTRLVDGLLTTTLCSTEL